MGIMNKTLNDFYMKNALNGVQENICFQLNIFPLQTQKSKINKFRKMPRYSVLDVVIFLFMCTGIENSPD